MYSSKWREVKVSRHRDSCCRDGTWKFCIISTCIFVQDGRRQHNITWSSQAILQVHRGNARASRISKSDYKQQEVIQVNSKHGRRFGLRQTKTASLQATDAD